MVCPSAAHPHFGVRLSLTYWKAAVSLCSMRRSWSTFKQFLSPSSCPVSCTPEPCPDSTYMHLSTHRYARTDRGRQCVADGFSAFPSCTRQSNKNITSTPSFALLRAARLQQDCRSVYLTSTFYRNHKNVHSCLPLYSLL